MRIKVEAINISRRKGTAKTPVESAFINRYGINGDAHAGGWHRQVSILGKESIEKFGEKAGRKIKPGEFAENIILSGIDLSRVSLLDRFKINETVLEVTQIGKKCHETGCPIYISAGDCIMPREGIFTRVIEEGNIKNGDKVEYYPKIIKIKIITLSDRASRGEYKDLSGPTIEEFLQKHYAESKRQISITRTIIPDEKKTLEEELSRAVKDNADYVFTTGGTGIGPRDITPEVVELFADKIIPGIMEHIRAKYGAHIPNALLSRSVAAIKKQTLIYTLPGSVKAVKEYMHEISLTMEHALKMLHGLGH